MNYLSVVYSTFHRELQMAKPKFENRPETDLAYIEHTGPYNQIPWNEYIPRLYAWQRSRKSCPDSFLWESISTTIH